MASSRLLLYKKLSMASTRSYCGQASEPPKKQSLKERLIKLLDKFEAERVAGMQKAENLVSQGKVAVIDAAKREIFGGFKPIGFVFGGLVGINSHMSSRRVEKEVTEVRQIVERLTVQHSCLGDEIAKITMEVSKLSELISKESPNPEVERKMNAVLAATEKLVAEYGKKSEQKEKSGGLRKIMHGFVTWLFGD